MGPPAIPAVGKKAKLAAGQADFRIQPAAADITQRAAVKDPENFTAQGLLQTAICANRAVLAAADRQKGFAVCKQVGKGKKLHTLVRGYQIGGGQHP